MTLDEIKEEISKLPRHELGPLLQWLRKHFDRELWERQIAADIALLGEAEYVRRMLQGMGQNDEKRKVALRIVGRLYPAPNTIKR